MHRKGNGGGPTIDSKVIRTVARIICILYNYIKSIDICRSPATRLNFASVCECNQIGILFKLENKTLQVLLRYILKNELTKIERGFQIVRKLKSI